MKLLVFFGLLVLSDAIHYSSIKYTILQLNTSGTSGVDGHDILEVIDRDYYTVSGVLSRPGYIDTHSSFRTAEDADICDYYANVDDLNNLKMYTQAMDFCTQAFGVKPLQIVLDKTAFARSCLKVEPVANYEQVTPNEKDQLLATNGAKIQPDDYDDVTTTPEIPHVDIDLVGGYQETASISYDSISPTKPSVPISFTVPYVEFMEVPDSLPTLKSSFSTDEFHNYSISESHIVGVSEHVILKNSDTCVRASLYAKFNNIKSVNYQIPICMEGYFGCNFMFQVRYNDLSPQYSVWWIDYGLLDNTVNRCYRLNGMAKVKSSSSHYVTTDRSCSDSFPCDA